MSGDHQGVLWGLVQLGATGLDWVMGLGGCGACAGCVRHGNLWAGLGIFGGMGVVRETGWIEWCL